MFISRFRVNNTSVSIHINDFLTVRFYFLLFITIYWFFLILAPLNAFADANLEKWKVKTSSKLDYINVTIDGTVQKGDQLRFYMSVGSGGECNSVEHLFTFYTMTKHPNILQIQGKKIALESMGELIISDIKLVFSTDHLMLPGHMVMMSSGLYDLDKHIDFLRKHKNHDVKLKFVFNDFEKKEGWKASDYFDILENSWSLNGVDVALNKAKQICLRLEREHQTNE